MYRIPQEWWLRIQQTIQNTLVSQKKTVGERSQSKDTTFDFCVPVYLFILNH